jgi:hypothetical protein
MNFDKINLNENRLAEAQNYFHAHYYEALRPRQGLEEILVTLKIYGLSGNWLDLGSGTSTLIWSIPLSEITSITCTDLYPETLKVLHDFVASDEIPPCYQDALKFCEKDEAHLHEMRKRIDHYEVLDALRPWEQHEKFFLQSYNLITQFGCFGLSKSEKEFIQCIGYAKKFLVQKGRLIGANWTRSSSLVKRAGHDNSYLTPKLIEHAAMLNQMKLLYNSQVKIDNDPDYSHVIIWVMELN